MYRQDLDALKGIAIIAVVLFHLGLLKSGYLGVDVFFVINGFFIVPSVVSQIQSGKFSFQTFLGRRLVRILPLIVLASIVSLFLGCFLMLPDDLENLSQSVIAGNAMSQNILSAITTKNYWAISNDYRPLMHLWYVGILIEFYLILPIVILFSKYIAKKKKQDEHKWIIGTLLFMTISSLLLYLNPNITIGDRFYFIQYRFFELGIGGIIGLFISKLNYRGETYLFSSKLITLLLVGIIFSSVYSLFIGDTSNIRNVIGLADTQALSGMPLNGTISLLLTVLLTTILVSYKSNRSLLLRSKLLIQLGKMSYSIFIWHQVMLAFYRYSVSSDISLTVFVIFLLILIAVSWGSYYYVEQKVSYNIKSIIGWSLVAFLVMLPSGWLYLHAGVIRDIPELNVNKNDVHRGMFASYCDRIYKYRDYPKEDNGKKNVLVEGASFGRDFANILLESSYKDSINIVYVYKWKECNNIPELVSKSDYIFTFKNKHDIPNEVWNNMKSSAKIMGLGTKNFGACNGIIYKNRFRPDYLYQTIEMVDGYRELNEKWKSAWGPANYIDMIQPVLVDDNIVRVFTDDGKYISPDTEHLSQPGAQWYARVLDWNTIWK
jgi:peptidoglycan/LPS O-acetylase OafA/YrhL